MYIISQNNEQIREQYTTMTELDMYKSKFQLQHLYKDSKLACTYQNYSYNIWVKISTLL